MNQNMMNILSQFKMSTNKENFVMSMLNPKQKQLVNSLKGKNKDEQNQMLADYCNKNNISKEQLENIAKMF